MRSGWGWIPNISANFLSNHLTLENTFSNIRDVTGKPLVKNTNDEYVVETNYSDREDSKIPWTICYRIPKNHDDLVIPVRMFRKEKLLLEGNISVYDHRGMAKFTAEKYDEQYHNDVDEFLIVLYLDFKSKFHEHTHHSPEMKKIGPDLLLTLAFICSDDKTKIADEFKIAVKKVSEQYIMKVTSYPITLKKFEERIHDGQIHDLYVLARGEFVYGSCYVEMFSKELSKEYPLHKFIISAGPESTSAVFYGCVDFDRIKINDELKEFNSETKTLSKETMRLTKEMTALTRDTKNLSKDVKNLTWLVLMITIVTVIVSALSILSDIYPEQSQAISWVVLIIVIVIVIIVLYAVQKWRSQKLLDSHSSTSSDTTKVQ